MANGRVHVAETATPRIRVFDPGRHSLLLGGTRQAGAGGEWIVLSPDGRRVPGTVEMPPRLSPTEIASEAVGGIWRNELGVETVRATPSDAADSPYLRGTDTPYSLLTRKGFETRSSFGSCWSPHRSGEESRDAAGITIR